MTQQKDTPVLFLMSYTFYFVLFLLLRFSFCYFRFFFVKIESFVGSCAEVACENNHRRIKASATANTLGSHVICASIHNNQQHRTRKVLKVCDILHGNSSSANKLLTSPSHNENQPDSHEKLFLSIFPCNFVHLHHFISL